MESRLARAHGSRPSLAAERSRLLPARLGPADRGPRADAGWAGDWTSSKRTGRTPRIAASNLSELELTLGEVAGAVGDAEQSVTYADRSGDAFQRMSNRTTHADALHQAGRRAEAEARFREAEQMQAESQPDYPLLYSLPGFRYCDLLLAAAERAAWQTCCMSSELSAAAALQKLVRSHAAPSAAARGADAQVGDEHASQCAPRHRPRPPHAGPRRALRGDPGRTSDIAPNCAAPKLDTGRGRPPPRRPAATIFPAASSPAPGCGFSPARAPAPRARRRPGRSLGNRRARADAAVHGRHPPLPRPPLLPREARIRGNRPQPTSPPPRSSSTPAATTAATKNSRTPNAPSWSVAHDPAPPNSTSRVSPTN